VSYDNFKRESLAENLVLPYEGKKSRFGSSWVRTCECLKKFKNSCSVHISMEIISPRTIFLTEILLDIFV
jgi:hypothetical protein